jgi:sterol desaturase/sphingolipid hydroxylase (fatty acid hydroxylase superfamily)
VGKAFSAIIAIFLMRIAGLAFASVGMAGSVRLMGIRGVVMNKLMLAVVVRFLGAVVVIMVVSVVVPMIVFMFMLMPVVVTVVMFVFMVVIVVMIVSVFMLMVVIMMMLVVVRHFVVSFRECPDVRKTRNLAFPFGEGGSPQG